MGFLRDVKQKKLTATDLERAKEAAKRMVTSARPPLYMMQGPNGGVMRYEGDGSVAGVGYFVAQITGNSQDGTNRRWSYTFAEVEKTSTGYGGWTTKSGGVTGTAYNYTENMNAATGLWGNGVTSGNLSGTSLTIQSAPTNLIVRLDRIVMTDGTVEYWFSYSNAIDGSC